MGNSVRIAKLSSNFNTAESIVEKLHRNVCDSERLSFCVVKFTDRDHKISFTVPVGGLRSRKFFFFPVKKNTISMQEFSGNVFLKIELLPTFKYFLTLFVISLILVGAIVSFLMFVIKKRELVYVKNNLILQQKINSISRQVAHDIQSPLAALEIVMGDLKSLPEESREITLHAVNRIKGIANNLSKNDFEESLNRQTAHKTLISVSLANIVNEKVMEVQGRYNIQLIFNDHTERNTFVRGKDEILLRIVSNLLNNSIEALSGDGKVSIDLERQEQKVLIRILDNGTGFPKDILENGIRRGKSVNKVNGQGLGLWYAKEEVEKNHGKFSVLNTGNGALVKIELDVVDPPSWFQEELSLKSKKTVVVVDDDLSIFDLWRKRLKGFDLSLIHIKNAEEFMSSAIFLEDFFFLVDYDLRGKLNGVELIEKYNLENAVLVTSSFGVKEVIEPCEVKKIKILPKQIVPFISVYPFFTPDGVPELE